MANDSAAPVIECHGLTKVFRDFWLRPRVTSLDNLDLEVRPREVFGLLGPNGAGKSTTIKLILGLLYPTRGRVSVFGRPPDDVASKARIGYLPEESYLYRFLDARETLDYYGRLFRLDRPTRRKRTGMLLEMVGLAGAERRPVGEYSKGMQRRIGLAQALINDPDLLILDEPTSGLDPIGTRQIKDLLLSLRARGKTVLLCSHLLADVEDICDRVTILYGGKVRALGTVDELLQDSSATVLETERLTPETIEKVRSLLEREEGKRLLKSEAPRKKLEALFLEIVKQAQAEGALTHGARAGGALAEFLREAPHEPVRAGVIEDLVHAAEPARAFSATVNEHAARTDQTQPVAGATSDGKSGLPVATAASADRSVLDALVQGAPATTTRENATEVPPSAPLPPATAPAAGRKAAEALKAADRGTIENLLDKGEPK